MLIMEKNYNKRENSADRRTEGRVFYRNNRNTGFRKPDRERAQEAGHRFNRETGGNDKPRFYTAKPDEREGFTREKRPRFRRPLSDGNRFTSGRNNENHRTEYSANYRKEESPGFRERRKERFSGTGNFRRDDRTERNENGIQRRPAFPGRKKEYTRRENVGENYKEELRKKHYSKKKQLAHRLKTEKEDAELRLNRYISMGGVCSRRDADTLITEGRVKVNGEVVQTVGSKVRKTDRVEVDDVVVTPERKVYLVLNKPKDYVTTLEDPLERKTVMSLIEGACKERIYPIGRLDRQTTGVLLFTNDGDLAKKLTHPKYEHKKIYHVFLDKPLAEKDMEAIHTGIELEDGTIKADEISYVVPDATEVGIEIHSGRNRIVRRIFEHLGYRIERLDRVYFAGITKKNLPRGRWRFLTSEEVKILKIYNA